MASPKSPCPKDYFQDGEVDNENGCLGLLVEKKAARETITIALKIFRQKAGKLKTIIPRPIRDGPGLGKEDDALDREGQCASKSWSMSSIMANFFIVGMRLYVQLTPKRILINQKEGGSKWLSY
jgi:hypothetical protein